MYGEYAPRRKSKGKGRKKSKGKQKSLGLFEVGRVTPLPRKSKRRKKGRKKGRQKERYKYVVLDPPPKSIDEDRLYYDIYADDPIMSSDVIDGSLYGVYGEYADPYRPKDSALKSKGQDGLDGDSQVSIHTKNEVSLHSVKGGEDMGQEYEYKDQDQEGVWEDQYGGDWNYQDGGQVWEDRDQSGGEAGGWEDPLRSTVSSDGDSKISIQKSKSKVSLHSAKDGGLKDAGREDGTHRLYHSFGGGLGKNGKIGGQQDRFIEVGEYPLEDWEYRDENQYGLMSPHKGQGYGEIRANPLKSRGQYSFNGNSHKSINLHSVKHGEDAGREAGDRGVHRFKISQHRLPSLGGEGKAMSQHLLPSLGGEGKAMRQHLIPSLGGEGKAMSQHLLPSLGGEGKAMSQHLLPSLGGEGKAMSQHLLPSLGGEGKAMKNDWGHGRMSPHRSKAQDILSFEGQANPLTFTSRGQDVTDGENKISIVKSKSEVSIHTGKDGKGLKDAVQEDGTHRFKGSDHIQSFGREGKSEVGGWKDRVLEDGARGWKDRVLEDGARGWKDRVLEDGARGWKDRVLEDGARGWKDRVLEAGARGWKDQGLEVGGLKDQGREYPLRYQITERKKQNQWPWRAMEKGRKKGRKGKGKGRGKGVFRLDDAIEMYDSEGRDNFDYLFQEKYKPGSISGGCSKVSTLPKVILFGVLVSYILY